MPKRKKTDSKGEAIVPSMKPIGGPTGKGKKNPPVTPPADSTVNAGPDLEICLPCRDISLFGRARDATAYSVSGDSKPCLWSLTSGPGGVAFSAPWSECTTMTFTVAGTYVVRLTRTDSGSYDETTITVIPASSQTAFYVDPTYTGGSNDGSAAHPWLTLDVLSGNAVWTAINAALASSHVIVYFSARQAGSDTPETESNTGINLYRTDTSAHWLTFDGMSKYNANDATPSWQDYSGSNKYHLDSSGPVSIGTQIDRSYYNFPNNYTIIRGFDASSRQTGAGNRYVVEYMDLHDIPSGYHNNFMLGGAVAGDYTTGTVSVSSGGNTVTGSGTAFQSAHLNAGGKISVGGVVREIASVASETSLTIVGTWPSSLSGQAYVGAEKEFGNLQYITYRNNTVANGDGEGIYVGGTYATANQGGSTIWGNTHTDILIESNDIDQGGSNGGEPDGIDLKAGLTNVWVRRNILKDIPSNGWGISSLGTFDTATASSHVFIEQNFFNEGRGFTGTDQGGVTIRNNIFLNSRIYFAGYLNQGNFNESVVGNTFYSGATNITYILLTDVSGCYVRNNLFANFDSGFVEFGLTGTVTGIDSDYNAYVTGAVINGSVPIGAHDQFFANGTDFFVNVAGNDFRLKAGSAAIGIGADLSALGGFAIDYAGTTRSGTWDVGAYEYAA